MYQIETKRLIGESNILLNNGKIINNRSCQSINLDCLKPSTGTENGFVFYLKENPKIKVCHIGITWQRDRRLELTYGTEKRYENQKYMQEALQAFIQWVINNTRETELWGLPNSSTSSHIIEKYGFKRIGPVEGFPECSWFLYRIER